MDDAIVELYSDDDLKRLRQKIGRWCTAHGILAAAALVACLIMVANTGTANAARMEMACVIVSTVAGWVILYGQMFVVTPCRRELRHALMLREGERERVKGVLSVTDERIAIRGSITVRKAEMRLGEETCRVLVCESRAQMLAAMNPAVLYIVNGYAAALEVSK